MYVLILTFVRDLLHELRAQVRTGHATDFVHREHGVERLGRKAQEYIFDEVCSTVPGLKGTQIYIDNLSASTFLHVSKSQALRFFDQSGFCLLVFRPGSVPVLD